MSASTIQITTNLEMMTPHQQALVAEKRSSIKHWLLIQTLMKLTLGKKTALAAAIAGYSRDLSHHWVRRTRCKRERLPWVKTRTACYSGQGKEWLTRVKKPRWLTLVTIFIKNLVLLVVLACLAQIIKKFPLKSGEVRTQMGLTDFEGKVVEVDGTRKGC